MLRQSLTLSLLLLGSVATGEIRPTPSIALREVRVDSGGRSLQISLAVFSIKDFQIRVIDNAAEDDKPKFPTLADAMAVSDCVAGCNGGFFERQPFSPVGGMVSDGHLVSVIDRDSWMKGLLVVRSGQPELIPVDQVQGIRHLARAGWTIRNGQQSATDRAPDLHLPRRQRHLGHRRERPLQPARTGRPAAQPGSRGPTRHSVCP